MNDIRIELSFILAVYAGLFVFGIGYNQVVAWMGQKLEGFMSLVVSGGVLITLSLVAVINWQAALLVLGAFAASGLPMIIGSIWRYIEMRERAKRFDKQTS